jgi:murein DD-endopeptidase MepM/ murein hydrolase activator NlpD
MRVTRLRISIFIFIVIFLCGFIWPEKKTIPVAGASNRDWNKESFWFEPWGKSGVHKGIDIFGKYGTDILSTTSGVVIYSGEISQGGKVILILGPKWRLHYFAHLASNDIGVMTFVSAGEKIGSLGDTGNARGKAPHLHYSIVSILPRLWAIDGTTQGYKKAFYINPHTYFTR